MINAYVEFSSSYSLIASYPNFIWGRLVFSCWILILQHNCLSDDSSLFQSFSLRTFSIYFMYLMQIDVYCNNSIFNLHIGMYKKKNIAIEPFPKKLCLLEKSRQLQSEEPLPKNQYQLSINLICISNKYQLYIVNRYQELKYLRKFYSSERYTRVQEL